MANLTLLLLLAIIVFARAKPAPDYQDGDGQEILKSRDSRYYGFPSFWYRRPLTDDDGDDYAANGDSFAQSSSSEHRNEASVPLYETAGAGWGR